VSNISGITILVGTFCREVEREREREREGDKMGCSALLCNILVFSLHTKATFRRIENASGPKI